MTRCVILAAGMGTRLRPFTETVPKAMVPLIGRALIDRQIEILHSCSIKDITIVAGYKSECFSRLNLPVVINAQYEHTNMVASLWRAAHLLDGEQDLVISYGDIVYERPVLSALLECGGEISVSADRNWLELWRTRMSNPLDDAENFRVAQDNALLKIGGRARTLDEIQGQYMGLIKIPASFHNDFVSRLKVGFSGVDTVSLQMTELLQILISDGVHIEVSWTSGGWLEVDTIEDLEAYETLHRDGDLDRLYRLS